MLKFHNAFIICGTMSIFKGPSLSRNTSSSSGEVSGFASLMLPTPVLGGVIRYMGARLTVFRFLPGFHSFAIFGLVLGKLP